MQNANLKTTPETNMYLASQYISIDDEINQAFIAIATHINLFHYEELLIKARIQHIKEMFSR